MSLKGLGFVTKVKAYIKKPQGINSYMKKMAYGKVNLNAPSLFTCALWEETVER